jgi:hypothetical protein
MCDSRRGFELVTRFIYDLYTRFGATNNYRAVVHLHRSYKSLQHTLSLSLFYSSLVVPWQQLSTMEILQLLCSHRCPLFTTELTAPNILALTSRHGPHRKHCSSIVACMYVAGLTNNGRCLQSHRLATGLYATKLCWGLNLRDILLNQTQVIHIQIWMFERFVRNWWK